MAKVALTGSIGSGKTQALKLFQKKGARIFSCDQVVSDIYNNPDHIVCKEVIKSFPEISKARNLRKGLRSLVFKDVRKLKELERIIHPVVIEKLKFWLRTEKEGGFFIAEVPLLFEKKLEGLFDKVILIKTQRDLLLGRLQTKYNLNQDEAEKRLLLQWSPEEKEKMSDFILVNNSSLMNLKKEVDLLWRKINKV